MRHQYVHPKQISVEVRCHHLPHPQRLHRLERQRPCRGRGSSIDPSTRIVSRRAGACSHTAANEEEAGGGSDPPPFASSAASPSVRDEALLRLRRDGLVVVRGVPATEAATAAEAERFGRFAASERKAERESVVVAMLSTRAADQIQG